MWIDTDTDTDTRHLYGTHAEIRAAWPQTSFPSVVPDDVLATLGLAPVLPGVFPEYDPLTQIVEPAAPVLVDGSWVQQWTARALTPEEYQALVPTEVSAAQGRLALLQADVLDAMEGWITTQPRTTQIEYSSRGTWRRDWPLVATGATALGLTEAQVDELFILAATL